MPKVEIRWALKNSHHLLILGRELRTGLGGSWKKSESPESVRQVSAQYVLLMYPMHLVRVVFLMHV